MNRPMSNLRNAGQTWLQLVHDRPTSGKRNREQGMALLMVITYMAILLPLSMQLMEESVEDAQVSRNMEAEVHAYFHARSSIEIARQVLRSQRRADTLFKMAANMGVVKGNVPKPQLWPLACKFGDIFQSGKVELMGMPMFDLGEQKGIGVSNGSFSCEQPEAEDGRVNVNDTTRKDHIYRQLVLLIRALSDFQEVDDTEIQELVAGIIDYIDYDEQASQPEGPFLRESSGSESDEAKNAPLDSVDELRLIEGMSEELFCLLKDRVTVYMPEKINVNSADLYVLRVLLCDSLNSEEERMLCETTPNGIDEALEWLEVCRRLKWAMLSPPFSTETQFGQFFAKVPYEMFPPPSISTSALKKKISTDARVIRIKSTGKYPIGKKKNGEYANYVTKTIEAVIDSKDGRYIYWREN
ncbi:MAG: hypothetical protein CMH54_13080 [Myxococcales bacterium]|nr:hypothetical protein [Myxococcales bacterium]|tara:strand:- start:75 stop:1310 length:1236 start_codon:yes stop_codon:yes gene_type:complete